MISQSPEYQLQTQFLQSLNEKEKVLQKLKYCNLVEKQETSLLVKLTNKSV